jgi:hypothetical protein
MRPPLAGLRSARLPGDGTNATLLSRGCDKSRKPGVKVGPG